MKSHQPPRERAAQIQVRVQPRAAQNQVVSFQASLLRVRVIAAPEKGQANAALLALLAGKLDLPQNCLDIVRGASSRDKVIRVVGLSPEELRERLSHLVARA